MTEELHGLYPDIPFADYLKYPSISSSGLSKLKRSPAHYQCYLTEPQKDTPAKKMGKLIHAALLEPGTLKTKLAYLPEGLDRRTKEGKAQYLEFTEANAGKDIIDFEDYTNLENICEAAYKHTTLSALLKKGQNEISGFSIDPITGVRKKIRIDKLLDNDMILDIKSTEDASLHGFKGSIGKYNYHIQAAFYLEVLGEIRAKVLSEFIHVAIEKEKPYGIGIYSLSDMSLATGSTLIRSLLDIYDNCMKTNSWPCYPNEVQTIEIPNYLIGEVL